jgi:hypothetical protein
MEGSAKALESKTHIDKKKKLLVKEKEDFMAKWLMMSRVIDLAGRCCVIRQCD